MYRWLVPLLLLNACAAHSPGGSGSGDQLPDAAGTSDSGTDDAEAAPTVGDAGVKGRGK